MAAIHDLHALINQPREDLSAEYKTWLDIAFNEHKALLAKAAISMANHGGGHIIIGFAEAGGTLTSHPQPAHAPGITQDAVNNIVARYCSPGFHCTLHHLEHPATKVRHPVIAVPGDLDVPVMSKRDFTGVIAAHRCYVRKPGPLSEEPNTPDEWRRLFARCIRAGRSELLDAVRTILHGQTDMQRSPTDALDELRKFCEAARQRWLTLIRDESRDSPARLPHGCYEMGFSLEGAVPVTRLNDLRDRLREAGNTALTGWPPFLELDHRARSAAVFEGYVEAWIGQPIEHDVAERTSADCDFWRASPAGELYTIRGYTEDDPMDDYTYLSGRPVGPGEAIDLTFPVWRVAEALLFAERFGATFDGVNGISMRVRFSGLENRRLVSLDKSRGYRENRISNTDEVVLQSRATPQQLRNNIVEIVHELLTPLYEKFDFYELSARLVREEIEDLQKRRG